MSAALGKVQQLTYVVRSSIRQIEQRLVGAEGAPMPFAESASTRGLVNDASRALRELGGVRKEHDDLGQVTLGLLRHDRRLAVNDYDGAAAALKDSIAPLRRTMPNLFPEHGHGVHV